MSACLESDTLTVSVRIRHAIPLWESEGKCGFNGQADILQYANWHVCTM